MCNECLINNLLHKITKIILKSQSFSTNQSRHIGIDFHNFHPIPLQKHTTHYENKQYFKNQFTQSKQNPQTATPISPAQSTPRDPGVSSVSSVSGVSGVSSASSSLLDQKNARFWSKSEQTPNIVTIQLCNNMGALSVGMLF